MPVVLSMRDEDVKRRLYSPAAVLMEYVGRPSKWGNPFEIGRDGTREEVVAKYDAWLYEEGKELLAQIEELRGKDLVCWCAPLACHGDILLELANE